MQTNSAKIAEMPKKEDTSHLMMTIEHDARLSVLEERFDNHSERWDRNIEKILNRFEELNKTYIKDKESYAKDREEFLKSINRIYLAIILGGLGVIWQFVWQILISKNII